MIRIVILLLFSMCAQASMQSSYSEGRNIGSSLAQDPAAYLNNNSSEKTPKFNGANPNETKLYTGGRLNDSVEAKLCSEDEGVDSGKMVIETAQSRERFDIDTETDPLFQVFKHKTVEEELQITPVEQKKEEQKYITKTCEEGGEAVTYECYENRHVVPYAPLKTITLSINHLPFSSVTEQYQVQTKKGKWYRHGEWETRTRQIGWSLSLPKEIKAFKGVFCPSFTARDIHSGQTYNIDCSRIQTYRVNNANSTTAEGANWKYRFPYVTRRTGWFSMTVEQPYLNITLQHDTLEGEAVDEWQTTCQVPEKMVEEGLCQYGSRELTQGPETRNINSHPIFKDEWQYKQIYYCKMIKDECAALKAQGCFQTDSKCLEKRENRCWIYQQTYHCPSSTLNESHRKQSSLNAFCLTGDCHPISYEANNQMLDVVSRLQVLKEIQDDIRSQQDGNFEIFKGKSYQCSRNCINFKDCCGGSKGWGVSLKLAGCREEEQQLAKMREADLCHFVGIYCSKKILKKCVSKKSVFCCFGTKLARLLHEQGRPQLGLGWGGAKQPCCRGVKVEELSQMDLSKMDLRELFSDVMKQYREPHIASVQEKTAKKVNRSLEEISKGMKAKGAKSGVLDGKNGL